MTDPVAREAGLERELSPRQLGMIAVGGAIGTGLFLGSGISIRLAGPAVVVSYLIGAVVAWLMTLALGQMAVRHPAAGSFGVHAEIYQGPWAGYTVRWSYWLAQTIAVGEEVIAAGIYARLWFPGVPLWVFVAAFSVGIVAANAMHVGAFGAFEYWFAMIKVVAIVLFVVFGAALLLGARPAAVPGAAGYADFAPYGARGVWLAVVMVMFSYLGTEIVAVTAGEARDPARAIPRALRLTVIRLILFYVASMALLMALIPWRQIGLTRSPFVLVFEMVGVPGAATLMNVVVLTAALSSINVDLYLTTRMLFSLSRGGWAPAAFGRLSRRRTPLNALWACTGGMALAVVAAALAPQHAFVLLVGVAIFGGLYVWAQIFATHLVFLRRTRPDDGTAGAGAPWSRWRTAASAAGLAFMLAILVTTWWVPGFRVTLLCGVPGLAALTVAWKLQGRRAAA
ncbi:MAG TPA: amino acid permease [Gemmatimonadales bacterium]|nr:amino acid permease [Gemmatimonadales bacterium]